MKSRDDLAKVFVELADTLIADFDIVDFLQRLTEYAVDLLGVHGAGVIITDQRGEFQSMASTSRGAHLIELMELQSNEGPCLDAVRNGAPLTNVELHSSGERWPHFRQACEQEGVQVAHALPLRLRAQVVGALNLFSVTTELLSPSDIELGQALADVATIGLLQQRAVHESERLAEQLQSALNSRILIEQAKGVLSARAGVSLSEAFDLMRQAGRSSNRSLRDLATHVVDGTLSVEQLRTR